MRRRAALLLPALSLLLLLAETARADGIKLGYLSQQVGPSKAAVGATISVSDETPGRPAALGTTAGSGGSGGSDVVVYRPASRPAAGFPTLASDAPLLGDPYPAGPGSSWYPIGRDRVCVYDPDTTGPCYRVVPATDGGETTEGPALPAIDPAAVAASVAERLPLSAGEIAASPSVSAAGLTGAHSWFWLEPAPERGELTIALAGERVTVTADPATIEWRFGDGAARRAGPGVPYRPGPAPAEAVRHRYETRCLPGDQGRNPYVLASCGAGGYRVEATVHWRISYRATGPVEASDTLPGRTTETAIAYPVSEARGFLVSGALP